MAETVGSAFCRGFGLCQHSNMQIILILHDFTGFSFCRENGGTHVFDLLAQRPLLSEMWNRSSFYKIDFLMAFVHFRVFRGGQGSVTSPLYKNDLCIFEGLLCSR